MTDTNTAVGVNALGGLPTGTDNTALGANALKSATSSTPIQNVAVGSGAGNAITSGASNVIIGYGSAPSLTTGNSNIIIGEGADVPTSSTSAYLNIGGVITGDMSSGAISLADGFLATTQSSGDDTEKIATTAFVQDAVGAATGALVKIAGPIAFDTNTSTLIDLRSYVTNDVYTRLQLVLNTITCTVSSGTAELIFSFAQQTNPVTSSVYSAVTVSQGAGSIETNNPAQSALTAPSNMLDGSGEILLRNFCRTNTALYPSADINTLGYCGGIQGEGCYGTYLCAQSATTTFDGVVFADQNGNRWQFSWELYGVLI